jgi:Mn2+/Fe2+ NRAMP family transporter
MSARLGIITWDVLGEAIRKQFSGPVSKVLTTLLVTSAITTPLAAAYATSGILGWKKDLKSWWFRAVWIFILMVGVIFSVIGLKPLEAIVFAQAVSVDITLLAQLKPGDYINFSEISLEKAQELFLVRYRLINKAYI